VPFLRNKAILFYTDDNFLGENLHVTKKNTEDQLVASEETVHEVNVEKSK
jgi:hypothetical protein